MIGRTLSHYKILEEISRGGMGIVYRALDTNLNREIALKVLPPELVADPERKRRFIQEAQAAAALEHPNIAVVHEIDEAEGETFVVMELIHGEKLRDTLQRKRLTLDRSLELAAEIAEGLSCAHEKGIVHRDLKPANVMVTEQGHAKIIDFGLAKLLEPLGEEGSEVSTALREETTGGKILGTVSYMSPEQARGEKVDNRSDIFSFGIVLYEMLTGEPPFRGQSGIETLNAIIKDSTPRLPAFGPDVTEEATFELQHVLDKCLAKDPAERYQTIKDVIVDVRSARRRLESGAVTTAASPARRRPWLYAAAIAAAALLGVVAIVLLLQEDRPLPEETAASSTKPSIAVLFFDNASGDPDLDWLRTGLTDMLITGLSQSPSLEVLSTDRLFQILNDMNRLDERITSLEVVQEVAELANATTIVLGSFMKAGETIRINIRVQDASTGKILTAENIEGVGESSIFPMVDELTRRIRGRFELNTADDKELDHNIQELTTSSPEAHRYFFESLNHHLRGNYEEAILLYEKAVELDPTFARALTSLSEAHNNLGHRKEAEEYARRALEHTGRLPTRERYYIEAWYYSLRRGTWGRAIEAYRQALRLNPNHLGPRHNMARRLYLFEHVDEAIEHYEKLRRRQYPSVWTHAQLAWCYGLRGQFDKGYQILEAYLEQHPDNSMAYALLGRYLTFWGKLDEAIEFFRQAESLDPGNVFVYSLRHPLSIMLEDWQGAEKDARWMETSGDPGQESNGLLLLGRVRLHQGRSQEALAFLEEAEAASEDPVRIANACVLAAEVLVLKEKLNRALEKAQRAQRERKNDLHEWQGLFYAALAQAKSGHWNDAANSAEELRIQAEVLPTEIEKRRYRHLMGELALARGDTAGAIKELREAESTLPQRWFCAASQHDLDTSPSQHVPIWYSLARAYLESGDEEGAAERFQRIVESAVERTWWPIEYVRSFYFLGKIHENRGEMEKAREYYRRFYEYWKDGDMDRERIEEVKVKIKIM